jgi:hypothetical protein
MKEGEPLPPKYFKLESVTLDDWIDDDGEDVTSAVLVESHYHAGYKPVTKTKEGKAISANNITAIKALKTAIDAQGKIIKHKGGDVLAVQLEVFRAACLLSFANKSNNAKYFNDHHSQLLKKGVINEVRGYVFFTDNAPTLDDFLPTK